MSHQGHSESKTREWKAEVHESQSSLEDTDPRRRRAEKRLSKRVFLESPFLLFPPLRFALKTHRNLKGQRGNGLSKNTLLDVRFSARGLRRSFGSPPIKSIQKMHVLSLVASPSPFSQLACVAPAWQEHLTSKKLCTGVFHCCLPSILG